MGTNPPNERFRIITWNDQKLKRMRSDENELHHLKRSEVFFPPEIFLGADGRAEVVKIH